MAKRKASKGEPRPKATPRPTGPQIPQELRDEFQVAREAILKERADWIALPTKKRQLDELCREKFDAARAALGWTPGQVIFPDDPNWEKRHVPGEENALNEETANRVLGAIDAPPAAFETAQVEPLTPKDARNKFCYERWQAGDTYKEIWNALKRHPEWEQLSSPAAIRGPIQAWAKKIGADVENRHRGRRPTKPY